MASVSAATVYTPPDRPIPKDPSHASSTPSTDEFRGIIEARTGNSVNQLQAGNLGEQNPAGDKPTAVGTEDSTKRVDASEPSKKRGFGFSSLASLLWHNSNTELQQRIISKRNEDAAQALITKPPEDTETRSVDLKISDETVADEGGSTSNRIIRSKRNESFDVCAETTTLTVPLQHPPTSQQEAFDNNAYVRETLTAILAGLDASLEIKSDASGRNRPNFEVHGRGEVQEKKQRWTNALMLIQSENAEIVSASDVPFAEHQLSQDACRTSAITAMVHNAECIRFARTVRSAGSRTGFKTTFSRTFALVSSSSTGASAVPRDCLDAFCGVVHQIRSVCTTLRLAEHGFAFKGTLGAGATAVVHQVLPTPELNDPKALPLVAKVVDFSHRAPYEAERDVLVALQQGDCGVEGVSQLYQIVPELQMIVTSPLGTSLNKLPWGSIRTGQQFARIARALKSLASRSVIHRDVSPGNIVLVDAESRLLCLTDFGMATVQNDQGQEYSGSKFFASDAVCRVLDEAWHDKRINFGFCDDLESLLKCVLWTLDFDCCNILNRAVKTGKPHHNRPKDILAIWASVWKTPVGKRFKKVITTMRAMMKDEMHDFIATWLERLGWTQTWTGLQ